MTTMNSSASPTISTPKMKSPENSYQRNSRTIPTVSPGRTTRNSSFSDKFS